MKRFFLYLMYDGTNYCGWQIQPNGIAVQEIIEKSLSTLLQHPTSVVGAGRTDAGVHARSMVAHFNCDSEIIDLPHLVRRLNSILPKDIAVYKIVEVNIDAHARFDAISRLYKYQITTAKDPFSHHQKYRVMGELDIEAMNTCANVLFEYEDFTSFSKLHTDVKTNDCTIMHAQWTREGNDYIFSIKANRFLRNMVRSIVGTLLDAGRGKIDADTMHRIIQAKDRGQAGTSVAAHGLFLEEVEYPNKIFLKQTDG